jgi:thiamine-monophosphate kinase
MKSEFGFIDWLQKEVRAGASVVKGIGDDTAVLARPRNGMRQLFTTDMLIEGRHFRLKDATGFEIGRKALAVNVSDIAAMGGLPTHAVVAAGIPAKMPEAFLKEIYRGLRSVAAEFGVNIVGGDTNRSDKLVISVALLGEVEPKRIVMRSGAKPGDVIFVTGFLGGSYRSGKHLNFTPRVKEARYLVERFKLHSMMDLSDGLASDIQRIAQASRVGAHICAEALPVARGAKGVETTLDNNKNFELLFTLSPAEAARLTLDPKRSKFAPFSPVGRIVPAKEGVRLIASSGKSRDLRGMGFDHFAR